MIRPLKNAISRYCFTLNVLGVRFLESKISHDVNYLKRKT